MTEHKGKITIRPAAPLDAANIVRLLKQCWEETKAVQYARVDDQKAMEYVTSVIREGFVAVADVSGRIVGVLALRSYQEPWSDDVALAEEWFFVSPSFRPRGAAALLLHEAERFADDHKVAILFGINAAQPKELDEFFASRRGYTYMGGNYMRTSNGQQEEEGRSRNEDDEGHSELA